MQHVDDRQTVSLTNLEIDLVVRGRHLQHAGAERRIDRVVADDRQLRAIERTPDFFADQRAITLIVRLHRERDVGHDRFRACGRDFEITPRLVDQLVAHVIERGFLRRRNHFLIGKRSQRDRIPVHHPTAAIDQALLVKIDENLLHRARVSGIHGEAFARPIAGTAESLQLLNDDAAVFFLPFPDPPHELFAPEIVARFSFLLAQPFLHHRLRCDAGVVESGQPEHFVPSHARATGQNVLDRVVEHVSKSEHAGHVRRRNHDRITRLRRSWIGMEESFREPVGIPLRLDRLRFVRLWDFRHGQE